MQSSSAERVRASLVALGMEMSTLTGRFAEATGLHQTDVRALWAYTLDRETPDGCVSARTEPSADPEGVDAFSAMNRP